MKIEQVDREAAAELYLALDGAAIMSVMSPI